MILPSAAASTAVSAGAGMSIASCPRPSERAASKVSTNCSGFTPATGMMRFAVPTKFEVSGLGETGGGGGNGVPTATGISAGRSIDGRTGALRNRITVATSATITRNTTHNTQHNTQHNTTQHNTTQHNTTTNTQ